MLAKLWRALKLSPKLQLIVMSFIQDKFLVGATGIFFDKEERILLFKHTYRGGWSLPGGYVKGREHPREGLVREVQEESGIIVSVDDHIKIRADRNAARLDITYVGTYHGGAFTPSREVKEAKLFTFEELPKIPHDQLIFIERALEMRRKNGHHSLS